MQQPTRLISTPFAQEGEKTEIQNVTGEFDNSATYRLGFPPLTMQSIRSGGKPPKGTDFNGVLFDITENISFLCKGGRYQYNAGLSTLIGGYPEGSNLLLDDNVTEVVSTVAGNQNNPNINMTGWILKPNKTTAVNVADASGETQQQVNYNGGSKWHSRVGGYKENERVVLTNGDIVKSTIDGNANDPNVDMTGWVKTNSASQVFDENGLSQQDINNSSKLLSANVLDFFTESELMAWKADPNTFDASDAIIRAQTLSPGAEITFPTGTFRITKKIPSPKHWVGVYGGYDPQGTLILVDNATAIDGVIDASGNSVDIQLTGIFFKGVQNRLHTLYRSKNGYIVRHSRLRVDSFAYGFISKGTYDFFDDCHFNGNAVAIKPVASNATNQSTMFGYRNCVFTYNAKAFDVSQTDGFGSYEDWMNILFESCGFEANEYGIYAPQRMWYVTLLNCWFEDNSAYGLYCPTSHVLEVNTRHNANSQRLVNEPTTSTLFGMIASLVDLEIKGHILSDVKFPSEYSPTGAAAKGKTISQRFTDDGGGVVAEIAFVREKNVGNYGGSGIEFSTSQSTLTQTLVPRWGVNQFGSLYPKQDILYNIGSADKRCDTVYTAKVMYSATVGDFFGNGSPEGVVSASVGSTYRRIDGTAGQPTFYTKVTGLGNTGWKAVTVVA